jgi:serine/threonine protein phosphatase PrpC
LNHLGHGGGEAASFCRLKFADEFAEEIAHVTGAEKAMPEVLASTLTKIFQKIDSEFVQTCREDRSSGTTATVVLVTSTHVVCANVGDSRAILVSSNSPSKILSVDHRPNLQSERARIIECGGAIEDTNEIGMYRIYYYVKTLSSFFSMIYVRIILADMAKLVKLNPSLLQAVQIPQRLAQMVGFVMTSRIQGSLCVSRAIGDAEFKGARRVKLFGPAPSRTLFGKHFLGSQSFNSSFAADKCDIVISEPSISITEREPQNDEFLVIASDGVWDFLETDYVAEFVREEIRKGVQPAIIAENLVTKALTQGSQDNITVIILFLNLPQGGSLRRSRPGAKEASSSWRTVSRS